tara:strand:+ start:32 stop:400 length:369 start_codon:yes stop_codon:yes gene_type:complete
MKSLIILFLTNLLFVNISFGETVSCKEYIQGLLEDQEVALREKEKLDDVFRQSINAHVNLGLNLRPHEGNTVRLPEDFTSEFLPNLLQVQRRLPRKQKQISDKMDNVIDGLNEVLDKCEFLN